MKIIVCLLLASLGVVNHAFGQPIAAHTHGEAKLSIVFEDQRLHLELESPAINILGFEHVPINDHEKNQYKMAISKLHSTDSLITLSPQCKSLETSIDNPFSTYEEVKPKKDSKHMEHAPDKHTHKHAHDHDHDHDHGHGKQHKDFVLRYQWECPGAQAIAMKLHFFVIFPGFEKIHAQWIAFGRQQAVLLDKNSAAMEIAP